MKKIFQIFLITGVILAVTGCYCKKTLTTYDFEFDNRAGMVETYAGDYGLQYSDRIISYTRTDGREIILTKNPRKKAGHGYVHDDTLFLQVTTGESPGSPPLEKIPVSGIRYLNVKRYNRTGTIILISVVASIALGILSF